MSGGLDDVKLHFVETFDEACEFMRWLGERRRLLAIDTETTGLDIIRDKVRLVQFGDTKEGWSIPWERWGGLVEDALNRYTGNLGFHNGPYDVAMLANSCGIKIPTRRVHDTMYMAHVLDSTRPVALKVLGDMYVDSKASVAQKMLDAAMDKGGWTWATIPMHVPAYSVYAAMDTVLTARLEEYLYPQVQATCPTAYELELAFGWVVMRMRQRGVRLDREYTERTLHSFEVYVQQIEEWCAQTYGVDPGKNKQVIERLEQDDVECTKMTPRGATSLDKEVLEELVGTGHPLVNAVIQHRKTEYLITHYLRNFPRFADPETDLIHADMFSLGARTGRMSIKDPPLQTLPRRSEDNPLAIAVRNCIIPRHGCIMALCDFDQIEMRLNAHVSGDQNLKDAFGEGDFFTNIARELYQDPSITKKDPRRQFTKNSMYALGYGAGAPKIALTSGAPLEQVKAFLANLNTRFPGIQGLQRQIGNVAMQRKLNEGRAYVKSPLTGRVHYADKGKEYALVNYLIQGMAAEVLKFKALEIDAAGLGEYMTLLVHDEVIMDVPISEVREAVATLNDIMDDDRMLSVRLTAGTDLAERWGDKGMITLDEVAG